MAYFDFKAQGSGAKAYYLGELDHGVTMDVSAKYEDYANLTADNFIIVPKTKTASSQGQNTTYVDFGGWNNTLVDTNSATYNQPSVSYNPSTGSLSFTSTVVVGGSAYNTNLASPGDGKWNWTYPSVTSGLTAKVYLLPEIEAL